MRCRRRKLRRTEEGRDKGEWTGKEMRGEERGGMSSTKRLKLAVTNILASMKSHSETNNEMKTRRKAAVDLRGKKRRGRGERRCVEDTQHFSFC